MIWDSVKLVFNVPDNWKKQFFISTGAKWRQWKSNLYTKHVEPYLEKPEMFINPPPDSGIHKEDWKDFVINRMSEESMKQSAELKKRRQNNKYPHRCSRKGYHGLRDELEKQGKLTGNPIVDRAIIWREGRADSDGEFDKEIQSTIEKLDDIIALYKEGLFLQNHPTDDILTQALGKPEHSGRVRGIGAYVTPTVYFNLTRGTGLGMGNAVQEMRAEFGKQLADMSAKILELQQQVMKKEVEGKGSCSNKIMDVNGANDLDVMEVSPFNISQNVRTPISKEINSPNVQVKLMSKDIPKPLKMLHSYAIHALKEKKNRGIKISIDKNVFGDEQVCYVFYDNIHNFCELEPIAANCICAYTWFLYKECENSNLLGRIRFVDPYGISHDPTHDPEVAITEKGKIIGKRLIGTSLDELALVPCNVGFHWILMVIDAHKETVYVLDPLRNENHVQGWREIMDTGIKMFNSTIKKRSRKFIFWEEISCQQQPDGKQCGFYVMRYMKDLIDNFGSKSPIPISRLFSGGFYSKNEIDEVRTEWAEFVSDFAES